MKIIEIVVSPSGLVRDDDEKLLELDRDTDHGSLPLEEAVKVGLVTPAATVVVELELRAAEVAHNGVLPARQLHSEASDFSAEETVSSFNGLRKSQTLARGPDSGGVADFGLDLDDMAHQARLLERETDGTT